ncbi:MAG: methylmalonyl-CoA mutase, partial [Phascolarctobacterium sp.]|nr:methylmalonyl-CoA mutase [Phascolarctobacterium sp.]
MAFEEIKAGLEKYTAGVEAKLDKNPERANLAPNRLYTPLDLGEGFDYVEKLGFPGEYPFTRGVQPTMYRGKFWTMRMYAGFSTAEESNKRYRYLLANGGSGLSCAFDLPTQIGYDSTDPMSEGEVGKVG